MPKRWYSRHEAQKTGDALDVKVVADHKPYFMTYRYPTERRQYNAFMKRCQFDCVWKFGYTLDELLLKRNPSEEERNYIYWFRRNCPVSLGDCTMNRVCRVIEGKLNNIGDMWKQKVDSFSYAIYRNSDITYTAQQFATVKQILANYDAEMKNVPSYAKAFRLSDDAVAEYRSTLTQLAIEELYCNCPSADILCNIVLDSTCSTGGSSSMAWTLCGDVIIKNLLRRNGGVIAYYVLDESGSVDYKGQKFGKRVCKVEEENIGADYE